MAFSSNEHDRHVKAHTADTPRKYQTISYQAIAENQIWQAFGEYYSEAGCRTRHHLHQVARFSQYFIQKVACCFIIRNDKNCGCIRHNECHSALSALVV